MQFSVFNCAALTLMVRRQEKGEHRPGCWCAATAGRLMESGKFHRKISKARLMGRLKPGAPKTAPKRNGVFHRIALHWMGLQCCSIRLGVRISDQRDPQTSMGPFSVEHDSFPTNLDSFTLFCLSYTFSEICCRPFFNPRDWPLRKHFAELCRTLEAHSHLLQSWAPAERCSA